ncbi:UNVERIFIED_CONTAM: hypothetical protein Sradi_4134100 [Sesamum radiatum]|uniref:Uncharacterized protein n=1 Tax=Sesamum radiatum TaxID=300843 RepID=A0AAW2P1J8_SESRA
MGQNSDQDWGESFLGMRMIDVAGKLLGIGVPLKKSMTAAITSSAIVFLQA